MKTLMERKNWLGYVVALQLFVLVPVVLWSQGNSGSDQDAFLVKTGATKGKIHVDLDTYSFEDKFSMYCPPRGQKGSKRIFTVNNLPVNTTNGYYGTNGIATFYFTNGLHGRPDTTNIVAAWNGGTTIEIVMNENNPNFGSSWEYNATVYPTGKPPIVIIRNPQMIPRPNSTVTTGGTIFQTKGSGGSSSAGKPTKPGLNQPGGRGSGGGGKTPPRRRGYITRIVSPTGPVQLPPAPSPSGGSKPNPTTTTTGGQGLKPSNVLFTGKRGNLTTYIRKIPTRSVRRIVLRGSRR